VWGSLEVLLSEEEPRSLGVGVLVRHLMELSTQNTRPTEENPHIRLRMRFRNTREDPIPIRPSKVRRRTQARDRVFLSANVLHDDIVHFVLLELGGEVDGDFDTVLGVLFFDGVQEGVEPFGAAEVSDDPGEVDLGKPRRLRIIKVIHPIPNILQNTRKRRHTNTRSNQKHSLEIQKVLRRTAKGSIHHHTGQHAIQRRVHIRPYNPTLLVSALLLIVEITANSLGQCGCEITDDTDVHGDVVFFGCRGESEGVPLEIGDLGAGEEDVLSGAGCGFILFDLEFNDFGGVLDDFGDERAVTGADFTEDTFIDED